MLLDSQLHGTALQHWWVTSFPWHLILHPLLLLSLGLGPRWVSINCSCAPCIEISGEILRCWAWFQRRVWVVPPLPGSLAQGISNSYFHNKSNFHPLLLNAAIAMLFFLHWLTLPSLVSHWINSKLTALTELLFSPTV